MRLLLKVSLLLVFLLPAAVFAEDNPESLLQNRIGALVNTELSYDLGFLWLDQVAIATFKLQKSTQPGIYIGSLTAKTVGIAATMTGNRKQQYVSMMKLMPDGSLRSVRHTSQKEKSGIVRAKVYQFNYEKGEVTYSYHKNNKLISESVLDISDEDFPSDIITTYYNLVAGVFGRREVGAHYEIPAFSRRGIGNIVIDFIAPTNRPKKSFFPDNLLICKVVVDQEVFDTKDGVIYIGYDKQMRPARGIVTDILGLGDVRGVMR